MPTTTQSGCLSIYVRLNIYSQKAYLSKILRQAIHPHLKKEAPSLKLIGRNRAYSSPEVIHRAGAKAYFRTLSSVSDPGL